MIKIKESVYNDGLLQYGSMTATYNAKKEKTGATFAEAGKLYYQELSARDGDIILASQIGYKIDLKVKTPKIIGITTSDKVMINELLYDIKSIDGDSMSLYLYLQKAGN